MSVSTTDSLPRPAATVWGEGRVVFWVMTVCFAILLLHRLSFLRPLLWNDDFQILLASWTWQDTRANLWLPQNEHSMPLGRISTFVLAHLASKQTNLPPVLALQGPLALVAAALLLYVLVRRETGQPLPALLAMMLFGINTHYQQAVYWFAASFAVLSLDTLLLGVLAAQRWRQTGRRRYLALSALWCALAPGWFGSGVLAGPLCALYLLVSRPPARKGESPFSWRPLTKLTFRAAARRILLPALVPVLGTVVSLGISLPFNGEQIANLPRVEEPGLTALRSFKPLVGLEFTLRAMVDDLIPGALGSDEIVSPIRVVMIVWMIFLALGFVWWYQSAHRPLLWLGLGIIVMSYGAAYTVRAYMPYEFVHCQSRYQLFPHLGLVLIVCCGLPRRLVNGINRVPPRFIDAGLAGLLGLLLLTQWPHWKTWFDNNPREPAAQFTDLERVEKKDALCEEHHIDAATARHALPEFEVRDMNQATLNGRILSGWDLLRGSRAPEPMTVEQARELLKDE